MTEGIILPLILPAVVAPVLVLALRHRLRRNVLDDAGSTTRVERAVAELWDAPEGATAGHVVATP